MIALNDVQVQLAEQLLICVRNKEMAVTYDDISKRIVPPQNPHGLGKPLGRVSRVCHDLGLPLISAKVINKSTKQAGEGFFGLCEELGIPTNGKSEFERWKAELAAIRSCTEWYKLEDFLGLDVKMPRPASAPPRVDPSYLDAKRPVHYAKSVDVLNNCFGERILGKEYSGWQQGAIEIEYGGEKYTVWFPKLLANGAATKSGWVNSISPDGMTIDEVGGKPYEGFTSERLVFAKEGDGPYLFRGVYAQKADISTPDHHVYEKIADIADFRKDLPAIHYFEDDSAEDAELIDQLKDDDFPPAEQGFEFRGKAMPVPEPKRVANRIVFPRNPQIAKNALAHAKYKCELDVAHYTFIRRSSDVPYTEPHHIVPISMQDRFSVSLDVEENIVSLCSTCHNHIHYGKGAEELITALYELRRTALESVGIVVTLEELLSFYHLHTDK